MMSSRKVYRCKHCKKVFLTAADLSKHKKTDHVEELRAAQQLSSAVGLHNRPTANLNGKYIVIDPPQGNDSSDSEEDCEVVVVQHVTPKHRTNVSAEVCAEVSDVESVATEILLPDGRPSPVKAVDENKQSFLQDSEIGKKVGKEPADVEVITLEDSSDSDDGGAFQGDALSEEYPKPEVEVEKMYLPVSPKLPNIIQQEKKTDTAQQPSGKVQAVIVDLDVEYPDTTYCDVATIDNDENRKKTKEKAGETEVVPSKKSRFTENEMVPKPTESSSSHKDVAKDALVGKPDRVDRTHEGLINTGGRLNCRICGMPFRPIEYRKHADICSRNAKKIKTNMDRFLRLL